MSKPMSNSELNSFISGSGVELKQEPVKNIRPWEGLDPSSKRTGVHGHSIPLNEYENTLINEAVKEEGTTKAAFIRQAAVKKAKSILGLN